MSGKIPRQSSPCGCEYSSALFLEPQGQQAQLGYEQSWESQLLEEALADRQLRMHAAQLLEPAVTEATSSTRNAHTQWTPPAHATPAPSRSQESLAEHSHQCEPWHPPAPQLRRAAETAQGVTPQRLNVIPNSKVQRLPCADWRHGVFSSRCVHTCTHAHACVRADQHAHT